MTPLPQLACTVAASPTCSCTAPRGVFPCTSPPALAAAGPYHPRMTQPTTVAALLAKARCRIDGIDAECLLAHAIGRDRSWLYAHADDDVAAESVLAFTALCARRNQGEPVAYLIGRQGFWTLDLAVSPATLVPRPETELLVELALARIAMDAPAWLADLGTGSGAIALALASERPRARVVATDASAEALAVARGNAGAHRIGNIEFRQGDWLAPLDGQRFDVIASNPPYLALGDPHLERGDLRFEPSLALASGGDGLDAIRTIIAGAPAHLRPGGWLLLEHGWEQGTPVRALLRAAGFSQVASMRDLEARERVSLGCIG